MKIQKVDIKNVIFQRGIDPETLKVYWFSNKSDQWRLEDQQKIIDKVYKVYRQTKPKPTKPMTAKDIKELIKGGGTTALGDKIDYFLTQISTNASNAHSNNCGNFNKDCEERIQYVKDIKADIKNLDQLERALQKHLAS